MTFTEMWLRRPAQDTLAALAGEVDVAGLVVEIGCWEGRSTVIIANAVAPRIVDAVDTWAGSASDESGQLAAVRDVFATWQQNMRELTAGNVRAHRMGWREFVPTITDPVAFAFIDAEHTYAEVHDNIVALLPLMTPGGIICGDDYLHPPVAAAVVDVFGGQIEVHGVIWVHRTSEGVIP